MVGPGRRHGSEALPAGNAVIYRSVPGLTCVVAESRRG